MGLWLQKFTWGYDSIYGVITLEMGLRFHKCGYDSINGVMTPYMGLWLVNRLITSEMGLRLHKWGYSCHLLIPGKGPRLFVLNLHWMPSASTNFSDFRMFLFLLWSGTHASRNPSQKWALLDPTLPVFQRKERLTYFLQWSPQSDILSDIYSDILFGILSWHRTWHIYSDIWSDIFCDIYSGHVMWYI